MNKLSKPELIETVQRIIDVRGTEEELYELMLKVKESVPDPNITDLMFWNEKELTATEIVEKALNYKPIVL